MVMLRQSKAEKRLLVVDACRSVVRSGRDIRTTGMSQAFWKAFASARGQAALMACGIDQVSMEHPRLGHGVFTHFLLEGLRGKAAPDQRGFVTIGTVSRYVAEKVPQYVGVNYPDFTDERVQRPWLSGPERAPEIPLAIGRAEQIRARADELFAEAKQRKERGDLDRALALLQQVLALVKEHPEGLRLREKILKAKNQARQKLTSLLEGAEELEAVGRLEEALTALDDALGVAPGNAGVLKRQRALKLHNSAKAARVAFETARENQDLARLEADGDAAWIRHELAAKRAAEASRGKDFTSARRFWDEARGAFTEARFAEAGRQPEALAKLQALLKKDPNHSDARLLVKELNATLEATNERTEFETALGREDPQALAVDAPRTWERVESRRRAAAEAMKHKDYARSRDAYREARTALGQAATIAGFLREARQRAGEGTGEEVERITASPSATSSPAVNAIWCPKFRERL
jgi:tetratricopeptide (TPR) repeat protein